MLTARLKTPPHHNRSCTFVHWSAHCSVVGDLGRHFGPHRMTAFRPSPSPFWLERLERVTTCRRLHGRKRLHGGRLYSARSTRANAPNPDVIEGVVGGAGSSPRRETVQHTHASAVRVRYGLPAGPDKLGIMPRSKRRPSPLGWDRCECPAMESYLMYLMPTFPPRASSAIPACIAGNDRIVTHQNSPPRHSRHQKHTGSWHIVPSLCALRPAKKPSSSELL